MIMKWTDLEPGDVLKYTEGYRDAIWSRLPPEWQREYFTVKGIEVGEDSMYIYLCGPVFGKVPIFIDSGVDCEFVSRYNAGPVFEIVSLKED